MFGWAPTGVRGSFFSGMLIRLRSLSPNAGRGKDGKEGKGVSILVWDSVALRCVSARTF